MVLVNAARIVVGRRGAPFGESVFAGARESA
jgi:hypothetical protein